MSKGFVVTIFEARDRIGGRVSKPQYSNVLFSKHFSYIRVLSLERLLICKWSNVVLLTHIIDGISAVQTGYMARKTILLSGSREQRKL
jgi:monoamine oxidase